MLLSSFDYDIVFTSNQLTYLGVLVTLYVLCLFSDRSNFILRLLKKFFQVFDIENYALEKSQELAVKNKNTSKEENSEKLERRKDIIEEIDYSIYTERIKRLSKATENEYLTQFSFFSTILVLFFCVVCEVLKTESNQKNLESFSCFFVFFVSLFMLFFDIKLFFKYVKYYRKETYTANKQKTPFLYKILIYALLFLFSALIAVNRWDNVELIIIIVISVSLGWYIEKHLSVFWGTKNPVRLVFVTFIFFFLLYRFVLFYIKDNANCYFWFFMTAPFIVLFVGELFEPYENQQKKYAIKCFLYMVVALTAIIFFLIFCPSKMPVAVFNDVFGCMTISNVIKVSFIIMVTVNCIFLPICIGYTWAYFAKRDLKKQVDVLVQKVQKEAPETSNKSDSSIKSTKSVGDSTKVSKKEPIRNQKKRGRKSRKK